MFDALTCCDCGIEFGVRPARAAALRADSSLWFYCPNGHRQHFAETQADRLRRERDWLKQQIAQKDDELKAARKREERVTKRVKAGLCPCCNRSFKNLRLHMVSKHKDV